MKRTILITILAICALTTLARPYRVKDIPNVQIENRYRFTSNPDGILSQEAVAHIDSMCYDLRHRGIAQTAVVAVKEINSDNVFDFAYELFSSWGVGSKSNSGIGILLVEQEREIRFVTGYGIEGVLPDALCKRIQTQYMLPHFRQGDYSKGMVAGLEAICSVLNGSELDLGGNDDYQEEEDMEAIIAIIVFIIGIIAISLMAIVAIDRYSRKCPRCKKLTLQKDSARLINNQLGILTYEDTYICTACGEKVKRTRQEHNSINNRGGGGPIIMGGGFGRGSASGSSFGGGWGGGRFGGGGAGSRW